jgi:hypothetical protein
MLISSARSTLREQAHAGTTKGGLRMSRHTRTIRLLGAVALASSFAACEGATTPTQPSATPPPPPPAGLTVSGRVLEFMASGANRPVPNLRLKVRMGTPGGGVVGGVDLADIVTDADGRYTISDVSAYVLYFQAAPGSDYRFLCEFHPVLRHPAPGQQFRDTDLPVVHVSWSGNQPIPGMRVEPQSVYGTVSEHVGGSLQPVAGASVSLDGGVAEPPATTSATGFYMICSVLGSEQFRNITAEKSGYMTATRQIYIWYDMKIDLELSRN